MNTFQYLDGIQLNDITLKRYWLSSNSAWRQLENKFRARDVTTK